MKENLQENLVNLLYNCLISLEVRDFPKEEIILEVPADSRFGDLSANIAMRLSRSLKKAPKEIAAEIINKFIAGLSGNRIEPYIKEVKAEGAGFINFYLSDKYFQEALSSVIRLGASSLKLNIGRGRRALVEFVSANPTGPLSVAHARQAAVGDSLNNILIFCGFKSKKEYYLNDEGNQINILGESVRLRLRELSGEKVEFPENYYQGEYIYEIARKSQIQNPKSQNADMGELACNYILDIIKKELEDFGVRFDYWTSQKKLRESGRIEKALSYLKEKGYLYESEGALWLASTKFQDDKDRVVIKSDKSYTYLAPDIAYHREKYRRGFQWLINLWGPDHHGYINRLKAAIQALGHKPESLSVVIVQLATIFREGKPVQMSTRRGEYITLREVLNEVGKDASRFFFLMRRTSAHLDFDLDIAKKQSSENPVYYIQYAHARILSILRNGQIKLDRRADLSLLKEKEEVVLIKKLLGIKATLNICVSTQDPYMLSVYLQELAEAFHKFYDARRVLGVEPALSKARLALIEATRIVIATGLELLGISAPEKM